VMPPLFASVDIREVDLDGRKPDCRDGIPNGVRIVCISSRIYDQAVRPLKRLMNRFDNVAFTIELKDTGLYFKLFRRFLYLAVHFIEGILAVYVRLADTKEIDIWTMNYADFQHKWRSIRLHSVRIGTYWRLEFISDYDVISGLASESGSPGLPGSFASETSKTGKPSRIG